jgi:hypothetical protein
MDSSRRQGTEVEPEAADVELEAAKEEEEEEAATARRFPFLTNGRVRLATGAVKST